MNIVIFVKRDNKDIRWEDCSEKEKKDIALFLNKQGLSALGYVAVNSDSKVKK